MMPLAVGTGVVVIAVAAAAVLLALIVAASMRGHRRGVAQRRTETRRDLDQALERADQAEHERDVAQAGGNRRPTRPSSPTMRRTRAKFHCCARPRWDVAAAQEVG